MLFFYELMNCIGYFLFMLIFMGVSIATARKKSAWIWYVIGAALQLVSLSGNQKAAIMNGTNMTLEWSVYFGILIVVAIIIVLRKKQKSDEQ